MKCGNYIFSLLVSFRRNWRKPHLLAEALQPLAHSSDTRHAELHSACSVLLAKQDVSLCCQCSLLPKFQWGCQFAFGLNGSISQWFDVLYLSQLLCAQLLRLMLVCMLSDWIKMDLFGELLLTQFYSGLVSSKKRRLNGTEKDQLVSLYQLRQTQVFICETRKQSQYLCQGYFYEVSEFHILGPIGFGHNCCIVTWGSLCRSHVLAVCVPVISFYKEMSIKTSSCFIIF